MNICWYTSYIFHVLDEFFFTFSVPVTGPDVFLCDVADFLS